MGRSLMAILFAGIYLTASSTGFAQDFPTRVVRFIVPFPPGGGTDSLARTVGKKLGEKWGQPVVVDNRTGGDGVIGVLAASKADPDGYTMALIISTHAMLPSLKSNIPYDLMRDFTPVINFAEVPLVLVANPALPVSSVRDLIALAKAKPGELNVAGSGIGGPSHLAAELFNRLAGVKITYIPYRGTGPAVIDLAGGHVNLMFSGITGAIPLIKAGKLKPLAVTASRRAALFPDLPTVAESGIKDFEIVVWYGIVVRSGTPQFIVDKVYSDVSSVIRMQEVIQALSTEGAQVVGSGPKEFSVYLEQEIRKWGQVVKQAGIPMDAQ